LVSNFQRPAFRESGTYEVSQHDKDKIAEYMEILDRHYLHTDLWFAGNLPTIADLSILANISQIKSCGFCLQKHVNLTNWFDRCTSLPGFDENQTGAEALGDVFKKRTKSGF